MTDIITLPRSVVEQALQSMRLGIAMYPNGGTGALTIQAAIDELRAALEQPQVEQEPVAWMYDSTFMDGTPLTDWLTSKDPREVCLHEEDVRNIRPLYLSQQPPRQPLTDEAEHQCPYPKANPSTRNAWLDGWEAAERAHEIGGE